MYFAFASAPPAEKSACSEVVGADASALGAGVDVKRSAANVTARRKFAMATIQGSLGGERDGGAINIAEAALHSVP